MDRYILAIDFGTSKIACAAAVKTENGVKISAYREAPSEGGIARGEIVNILKTVRITSKLISQIKEETGEDIKDVIAGVSGTYLKTLTQSNKRTRKRNDDLISEEEVNALTEEIMNFKVDADEAIIHVLPQYYNIDELYGEIDPVGMPGNEIEGIYKLAIGKKRVLTNIDMTLEKLGLKPGQILLKSIASSISSLTDDEREIGTVLIDIGAGTTELAIVKDGIIRHVAIIPFGGKSVTDDICSAFGISSHYAEKIKIKYGSCFSDFITSDTKEIHITNTDKRIPVKTLSLVIEARMVEILEAVKYEISKSGIQDELPGGIVITGGGAQIMHLPGLIKNLFGISPRTSFPTKYTVDEGSCEDIFQYEASSIVGLALSGIEHMPEENGCQENDTVPESETPGQSDENTQEEHDNPDNRNLDGEKTENKQKKNIFKNFVSKIFEDNGEV